ncbi:hypothetical protein HYV83_05565 [Candidatus Woesearchaeota archaeon]|nr:hypothetical protein [Candidatus Woesearchaeota archaeon]
MLNDEVLWKLEGLHTAETVAKALGIGRQSAINLLSRLKKEGYVTTTGGGKIKRIYKISMKKQRPRDPGMFDIINKYSPMKLAEWYDHQVHGHYGPEEAIVDAVQTQSFRAILASMRLFNHITDWPRLYRLAKEKDLWVKVRALYDVARVFIKVKSMPALYERRHIRPKRWEAFTQLRKLNFPKIAEKWHVYIPFNPKDIEAIKW